jgi:hypothetical protein
MVRRVEWLKLILRNGPANCSVQFLLFLVFEVYYGLCMLRGYPARHFLDPSPEEVRGMRKGERVLLTWPSLPLSIRVLDRVFPFASIGHAEFAPYTPDAAAATRVSGRRFEVIEISQGEFRSGGSHK